MKIPGLKRRDTISYNMFDLERSAAEAKRFNKCENIYHRGQDLAWNGKEVLDMLVAKHGKPKLTDEQRTALQRIFAIILWGELAAWRISAQLADRIEPLEAKMAATSQVHDEARHFYVMYDYLSLLGEVPKKMDFAPRRLIETVLNTDNLAYKMIGMQLMIETLALTIFQSVRLAAPEPVLTELLKYFEKDEARHVGLGMQYLPMLMKDMNKVQIAGLFAFQARILSYGMWEAKVIEDDLRVLGISARDVIDRGRAKQMLVLRDTFESLGIQGDRGPVLTFFSVTGELLFPSEETRGSRKAQWKAAWRAFRGALPDTEDASMSVHDHEIVTAQDSVATKRRAG
ncbi:MAG: ferritin-like domain-containing protein [Kofleriaceae bacterium]|nr:ferritin-like domain-containing protein [Kofleriaceae bacterium]